MSKKQEFYKKFIEWFEDNWDFSCSFAKGDLESMYKRYIGGVEENYWTSSYESPEEMKKEFYKKFLNIISAEGEMLMYKWVCSPDEVWQWIEDNFVDRELTEELLANIKGRLKRILGIAKSMRGGVESDEIKQSRSDGMYYWKCPRCGNLNMVGKVGCVCGYIQTVPCTKETKPHETPTNTTYTPGDPLNTTYMRVDTRELYKEEIATELKAALESLRMEEKTEADGWEHFFDNCCPGDNVADGWNYAAKEINQKIDNILKEYSN